METFVEGSTAPVRELSFHADHLGSIRFLTDEAGQVVNEYDYDAYGRPEIISESFAQPFLYTAREWEPAAELYHYRARAYDPDTGRFFQEDPIWFGAEDANVYRYLGNNPINARDPSGLSPSKSYGKLATSIALPLAAGTVRAGAGRTLASGVQAATVKRASNSALQKSGAAAACAFFTVASGIANGGGIVDGDICGVIPINNEQSDGGTAPPVPIVVPESRTIPKPKKPKRGCRAICRADANDNIPGNIKPGDVTFAFGEAVASTCPAAVVKAKRIATRNLGKQPKHIPCKTAS